MKQLNLILNETKDLRLDMSRSPGEIYCYYPAKRTK